MNNLISGFRKLIRPRASAESEEAANSFFVDIHSHIIPAIDDGPATMEAVVAMLRQAHRNGTREMVATPHMFLDLFGNLDPRRVKGRFGETVTELAKLGKLPDSAFLADMVFYPGAENLICREFLDALEARRVLTLNDSRYILVEAPPYLSVIQMRNAIDRILAADLRPVLAHPERYVAFQQKPIRLSEFHERGCVIQVNAGSVAGIYGRRVRTTARALLKKDLVHVLASDGHGTSVRPHDLGSVYTSLQGTLKKEKLNLLCSVNPGSIVRNGPLVSL